MTGEQIHQRYDRLLARRQPYEALLNDVVKYVIPHRGLIGTTVSPGYSQTDDLFDSTAIHANELLAARMHGALFSPAAKNFEMATRDSRLNRQVEIAQWFEAVAAEMQLAINLSNFYSTAHEVCLDAPCLATSAQFCEERMPTTPGFNGLNFRAFSIGEFVIDENADGEVDTLMRTFKLSARAAVQKWTTCSDKTKQLAKEKPEELVEFLHAIYYRPDGKSPKVMPDGSMEAVPASRLPYASVYVEKIPKNVVEDGGYHECPFGCIRWTTAPEELYGRSPAMSALPDIKTLNKSVELFLQQWAIAIQPPFWTTVNNVVGQPAMQPGKQMTVRRMDGIKEFITNARFDVTMAGIESLRKSVRDMFFSAQLELKQSPEMSATEVAARMQLMNQFLGPASGRFMSDWLQKILLRIFGVMSRIPKAHAVFPPTPPRLAQYIRSEGADFEIRFLTPMARQQRNPELAAIERYTQMLIAIQQLHPAALDTIDFDKALAVSADIMGVPASVLRGESELAQVRAAKMQAQQEAAQLAGMQAIAESAGKAAPMVKALQPKNGGA